MTHPAPQTAPTIDPATLTSVFVYGTLMPGFSNARIATIHADALEVRPATLDGFDLFDLGAFPGVLPGEGTVTGFVYTYAADDMDGSLKHLDRLEGTWDGPVSERNMYNRVPVTVNADPGPVNAWVYVWNMGRRGLGPSARIPSGSWARHRGR